MPFLPLLLALTLASPDDPEPVVRRFLAAEAAGDRAAAAALWVAPESAFTRRQVRRMELRCMRLLDVAAATRSRNGSEAVVETRETIAVDGTVERSETSHSRFVLTRTDSGWRIARRESLEGALVERLAQAGGEAPAGLLAASPHLMTGTFVRLCAERVKHLVNERRLDRAEALARIAGDAAARLGDPGALAEVASVRSLIERQVAGRDLALAVALCEEAIEYAEAAGDADTLARALLRLARAREDFEGRIDAAPLERVLAIAEELEDTSAAAHAATHLSRHLEVHARRREAFRYAELASRYAESSDDASAKITAALMLGAAFLWYGDPALAQRHFQRAFELSSAAGYVDAAASALTSIAGTHAPDESLRIIDEGLARLPASGTEELLHFRASILMREGRFDEAERDLRAAAARERPSALTARSNAALLAWIRLGQQRYEEAAALAAEARRHNDTNADHLEAAVLHCLGRPEEAVALLERSVRISSSNRFSIADPRTAPFNDWMGMEEELLLEILVEQGQLVRALEVAEEGKANLLRNALEHGGAALMPEAGRQREQELEARIRELNRALVAGTRSDEESAALSADLIAARADLLEFRQRILAAHAPPPESSPAATLAGLEQLPPSMDGVTILSYTQTKKHLVVFLIGAKEERGRRRIEARILPLSRRALEQKVARYTSFLGQRNLRVDSLGEELYALLVAPFESAVREARLLCVIPHRALWQLPFHALGRNGRRLMDDGPVFYAPSIAALARADSRRPRTQGAPSLLAFANPEVGSETAALFRTFDTQTPLGAIPETEWEVRAIARIYGSERSRVRIGRDAGEGSLKREAAHYDVLHIATHGLVQDNAPMFSSLVLSSEDEAEDGLLEAREIVGLDLAADTVVLSACDTGKPGMRGSGDPVVGLAWAFLAAGCRTTVVSQWKAQSAATAKLMVEFHRHLAHGASKPEALRAAQSALRREPRYEHPFYWAPFIVVGAP